MSQLIQRVDAIMAQGDGKAITRSSECKLQIQREKSEQFLSSLAIENTTISINSQIWGKQQMLCVSEWVPCAYHLIKITHYHHTNTHIQSQVACIFIKTLQAESIAMPTARRFNLLTQLNCIYLCLVAFAVGFTSVFQSVDTHVHT